jgi:hypothetical protein
MANSCETAADCSTSINISASPTVGVPTVQNGTVNYTITIDTTGSFKGSDFYITCPGGFGGPVYCALYESNGSTPVAACPNSGTPGDCATFFGGAFNQGRPAWQFHGYQNISTSKTYILAVWDQSNYLPSDNNNYPINISATSGGIGTCYGPQCSDSETVYYKDLLPSCNAFISGGPGRVSCDQITTNSYRLNWTPGTFNNAGGTAQQTVIRVRSGTPFTTDPSCTSLACNFQATNQPFGMSSIIVTGLQPNTTYFNRVAQLCTNSSGNWAWKDDPDQTVAWGGNTSNWSCTTAAGATPVNGACGSANGKTYANGSSSYGSDTQCSSGSSSNAAFPTAGNTLNWTCSGQNGGSPASCSASQAGAGPVAGVCGSANGRAYPNGSSSYNPYSQCSSGNPSTTSFPTAGNSINWTCSGANGGASSGTCSASQSNPSAQNGVCGQASGVTYPNGSSTYTPYSQCAVGSPSDGSFPSSGTTVTWTCSGVNGGSSSGTCSASQSAPASVVGTCGTAHGKNYPYGSTGFGTDNLCATGVTPWNTGFPAPGTSVQWWCAGENGGTSNSCIAEQSPPPPTGDIKCNGSDSCTITTGTSATLTWSSQYASSCTVNPGSYNGTSSFGQNTGNLSANTTYTLNCVGAGGGPSNVDSVTVIVTGLQDFTLSHSPPTRQSVSQGGSTAFTVTVSPVNGFTGNVTLTASNCPSGATCTFPSGNSITGGAGSKIMQVTAGGGTPASNYDITVTGTSGALTHTTIPGITVTVPVSPPTLTLNASPNPVNYNQPTTLTWSTVGNTPIACSSVAGPWSVSSASSTADTVWFDDVLPTGASGSGDGGDSWSWVSSSPSPFSGTQAHRSNIASGQHQHYFTGATNTLSVNTGDNLFAYVYLDPSNMPTEIMLQFNDGDWEQRAYWGANNIAWGTNGTDSRRYMGALPASGQWVRLEIPASQVGLEGKTLNGMAFTLYDGRATWDKIGKSSVSSGNNGSGSTLSSSLTSSATFTMTCTNAYGSDTKSVTVNVNMPPGDPGNPGGGPGASCGQINLSWTDVSGETGYYVYRNTTNTYPGVGGRIATKGAGVLTHQDNPPTGSYYYWISSYNGAGESSPVSLTNNPVGSSSCDASISANKDITKVNGGTPSGYTPDSYNNDETPANITYKKDDIVGFAINVYNNGPVGSEDAGDILVTDRLINLKVPTSGWAMKINNTTITEQGGANCASIASTLSDNRYKVCGSEPTQTIYIKVADLPEGELAQITFNAQLTVPSGFTQAYSRVQNTAGISYTKNGSGGNGTTSATTPLLPFSVSGVPGKIEVAP